MDRQIVYAGSIPLDTDLLNMQRNVQVALGALAQMAVGLGPIVDGLGCYPGPAGPSVTMTPGSLTTAFANDGAPYGALAPDPMNVVQTGLLLTTVQIPLAEPGDAGHVTTWLIQAQLTEQDVGPVVLPYWNAANPSVPYSGPNNSGLAQATSRVVRVIFSAKASGPQVAGETAIPPPDAGWSGLFSVTTYFGKPVVDQSDIVPYALAPRLRYTLATIPPGPTTQLVYTASGSWTVPPQVRWARVRVIGGGGGGGCGDTNFSGGGGGAGGYAEGFVPLEPGRTYPILVGVGGLGGSLGSSGGWGNTSDFGGMVTAGGGEGGGAGNPDSHGGAPGQGARGSLLQSGGYGGDGCNTALVPGGNGGAGAFGGGGRGADEGGIPAFGIAGGSGGGGGYGTGSYGGGGAAGLVILEF